MLWPQVSLSNDPDHWSGLIGTAFTSETQWQEWFASYREFINHYATFAQEVGVDMLSIGEEMGGVTHGKMTGDELFKRFARGLRGPLPIAVWVVLVRLMPPFLITRINL